MAKLQDDPLSLLQEALVVCALAQRGPQDGHRDG